MDVYMSRYMLSNISFSKLVLTAYVWTRDVSFRNWFESTIHMLFLSITKAFQRIIHWRGSTSGAPPLTTAPLYGVCRVKTSEFWFDADSPRNMLSGHIHVHNFFL